MKKLNLVLVVLGAIGVVIILGQQFYNSKRNVSASESSDARISLMKEFWETALNGKDTEKFISITPQEFYDSSERCSNDNLNHKTEDSNLPRRGPTANNLNTKQLRKTAKIIGEKKYTIANVKIIRSLEKEAIVEVKYTKEPNWTENFYFFMVSIKGDWKIFEVSPIFIDDQEEYAKDCK